MSVETIGETVKLFKQEHKLIGYSSNEWLISQWLKGIVRKRQSGASCSGSCFQ